MKTKCGCVEKEMTRQSEKKLVFDGLMKKDFDTLNLSFTDDNFVLEMPVSQPYGCIIVRIKVLFCPICGIKL